MTQPTTPQMLPGVPDASSPDGSAQIRHLINSPLGDLTHAVCLAGGVSAVHDLPELYEAYFVLAGRGEIWRRTSDREAITALRPGRWVEMPPGTQFQYRAFEEAALVFLVVVLPTWQKEKFHIKDGGIWPARGSQSLPASVESYLDGWMSGDLHVAADCVAPDGSGVRRLIETPKGSLTHCTLFPDTCTPPTRPETLHEIWYVIEGHGEFWHVDRDGTKVPVTLWPGISVEVHEGATFQLRASGINPLRIVKLTIPSWPERQEA